MLQEDGRGPVDSTDVDSFSKLKRFLHGCDGSAFMPKLSIDNALLFDAMNILDLHISPKLIDIHKIWSASVGWNPKLNISFHSNWLLLAAFGISVY